MAFPLGLLLMRPRKASMRSCGSSGQASSIRSRKVQCKAGDHAAFPELIKQSSSTARRAIRTIARNPADVDDVMLDTFVKAFQALRSFDQRSKFSTWLTRIAINNALMLLRRQKTKREISLEIDGEEPETTSFQLTDKGTPLTAATPRKGE